MRMNDQPDTVMDQVLVLMHREDVLLMPVRRLYRKTHELFAEPVSLIRFTELLGMDRRFLVLFPNAVEPSDHRMMTEDELEAIGFDDGPKVMIRSRMPDRHEMLDMLIEKADKTFDSLKNAWDIRPEDDVDTEDRLLSALAKAQRLQRELRMLSRELEKTRESLEYT